MNKQTHQRQVNTFLHLHEDQQLFNSEQLNEAGYDKKKNILKEKWVEWIVA